MNPQPQPDPSEKFLAAVIANTLRIFLTPFYYTARSDMGIHWTALVPILIPLAAHGVLCNWLAVRNQTNAPVIALYAWLWILGFIRNTFQARERRRVRDWSVQSWSPGKSLLEPVLLLVGRAIYRKWGQYPWVRRLLFRILSDDFVYYGAEPGMLLLAAWAVWSIGATVWFYPILLAVALIAARSDAKLALYLKAHEVMDGKKLERSIAGMLQEPAPQGHGIPVAQIPVGCSGRPPTDNRSVFERLSPDLQLLLARDRAAKS
jgi:hypothetical protein